jgi:two-component sensor histidine kinase
MRHSASQKEFIETYGKRLNALAISNRMLIDNDWVSTDLRGLLRNVMRPHLDGDGDRLSLEGPDVDVDSRTCLALALTVHELATNATKYGALGHPQGRLRIAWAVETGTAKAGGPERALRLTWSETGAGKAQLPDSEGFGSQLMAMMIQRSLDGTIEQSETAEGLATTIRFPLPATPRREPAPSASA